MPTDGMVTSGFAPLIEGRPVATLLAITTPIAPA
jgi:hypothetical protein